jgi:aurora kinase
MKRELELQYRLSVHPNIVKMFGCFYDDQYVYSVLEYLPEGNLYQRLKKEKIFTDKVTIHIIQQIVSALWHLQMRNVIHRDIKPENILVKSSPEGI